LTREKPIHILGKRKGKEMTLNTEISTSYDGKRYTGFVVEIKKVQNRELITIMIEDDTRNDGIGYRSLYADKMSETSENLFA
jgi:FKBP-type peptidyl-prolyl cis-trans isomerase (trigger factor)